MDTIAQQGSTLQIRRAQKQKARLRIGLSGPSGSGKTYSALLLALGMCPAEKICIIDTENGSADLYDHLGAYNVIQLSAPYSPERYIEAIHAAEVAGMDLIIIDSVTHEWDGKGGVLELNQSLADAKFKGNTWAAWSKMTPRHQKFIEKIVTSSCHIITTLRSKTDTIQVDNKVKKVGTKEIQRDGFEYELTANFTIDREGHLAVASKDRTGIFIDLDPFVITQEIGKMFQQWADSGVETLMVSPDQISTLEALIERKGKTVQRILEFFSLKSLHGLTFKQFEQVVNNLSKYPDVEQPEAPKEEEFDQSTSDEFVDDVSEALEVQKTTRRKK